MAAFLLAALAGPTQTSPLTAAGASCEDLRSLPLAAGHVDAAQIVAPGAFRPPTTGGGATRNAYASLPSFCRVSATLTPSSDSDIKIEVWLPSAAWNAKLQAVGNGGWAGTISYSALAAAVSKGYAAVSTDTGHSTEGASFALGHPEKFIDYSYRSEHEMTVAAKSVIARFYGSRPRLSYFNGCSTGGRQAIVEASRYPDDFDGIVAGAAANPKAHLDAWRIWMAQAMHATGESFVPPAKHRAIHDAVVAKCDAVDGATDGLIENPTQCTFDPSVLLCKAGDEPGCLTAAQVKTVRTIMSQPKNRKGEVVFPTYEPGTELGWSRLLGGPDPYDTAVDQYKYCGIQRPGVELAQLRSRPGHASGRCGGRRCPGCCEPGPDGVRIARRQAAHLSRLVRPKHRPASQHQLLSQRVVRHARAIVVAGLAAAVHGARDGPLQRRRRP